MKHRKKPAPFKSLLKKAIKRHGSQQKLADILKMGRTAVSAWLTGDNKPSVQALIELGNNSPFPDCLHFWGLAGLDDRSLLGAAREIAGAWARPLESSETVLVPEVCLTTMGFQTGEGRLPIPVEAIPNRFTTAYVIVNELLAYSGRRGDVLLLDTHIADGRDPKSFWDQVVIAKYGDADTTLFFVGVLRFVKDPSQLYSRWSADLWPWPVAELFEDTRHVTTVNVGGWPEPVDMKSPHPSEAEARQRISLKNGWSILARVVGWFGREGRQ
jgi:hypothetical protein